MVITRSPEGRDNDRPFSGPEIAVAGASTSGSVVPSVSQTEEQAKSATGASNDVTEAESVDESTDASMDTSSDKGSTVRELNRQLESTDDEHDDGNGMVSDTGSAHHDHDNSEWEHQRPLPKKTGFSCPFGRVLLENGRVLNAKWTKSIQLEFF